MANAWRVFLLAHLDLSANFLSGEIPSELGVLSELSKW
jgi:hypothetical protein